MKCLVVYSSVTGNTQKIAEAILSALPADSEIYPVREAPDPDGYDFIAIGSWVDKGMPDAMARQYMEKVHGKQVGIFMTLGAWPDSDHAKDSLQKAGELLKDNTVVGTFICQGKVDPKLIERMRQMTQNNPHHPHAMDENRKARLAEAAKHPNQADCENARQVFTEILSSLQQ